MTEEMEQPEDPGYEENPGLQVEVEPRSRRRRRQSPDDGTAESSTSSSGARTKYPRRQYWQSKETTLAGIHDDITATFTYLGLGSMMFLPVTGTVLLSRAEHNADLVTNLARKDPRVYRALVVAMKYAAYAQMAEIVGIMGVAVAVDMGNLKADSLIAQKLIGREIAEVQSASGASATAAGNGAGANAPGNSPSWVPPPAGTAPALG